MSEHDDAKRMTMTPEVRVSCLRPLTGRIPREPVEPSIDKEPMVQVPDVAIRWIALNSAPSNYELACLTNVNRFWRNVVKDTVIEQALDNQGGSRRQILLLPSMIRRLLALLEQNAARTPGRDETFCAAWFQPSGVQQLAVSLQQNIEEDEGSLVSAPQTSISEPFAPSGNQTYEGSADEDDKRSTRSRHRSRHRRNRSRSPASLSIRWTKTVEEEVVEGNVLCCPEWRGLRLPMEVLAPFGYAETFVYDVLQTAMDSVLSRRAFDSLESCLGKSFHSTTFAVRGATVARPESYCLCMEDDKEDLECKLKEVCENGEASSWAIIRLQELKQSVARQSRRRRELQRDVLPRILTVPSLEPEVVGRRERSLQFLNADGSHAVCMTTPLFDCGPLTEPVTVFCVAVATEDGCFLSGVYHRFELGHMYPNSRVEDATELSPVCIATDSWYERQVKRNTSNESLPYKFSSDDSSYDGSEEEASGESKCDCMFKGTGTKLDILVNDQADDDDSDSRRHRLYRGRMGPGMWHLYVAVFDGAKSLLRVDGIPEVMELQGDESRAHHAMLDGLTIGSDHCFGMSLCCGFGSGGQGEGAIAEIAVFRGHLDVVDIDLLERQMIERHGIPPVPIERQGVRWVEDELLRQSQAIFIQPPDCEPIYQGSGVPLRYLARHRSVAWHQYNAVTGKPVRIPKIGSQPGEESSEW